MSKGMLHGLLSFLVLSGLFVVQLLPYPVHASILQQSANNTQDENVSLLERIRAENRPLIVGVKFDFPPFGIIDENDEISGFDIDLIRALAQEWGIEVEFVPVTSSSRIPKLAAGEVDMVAASMTHTKQRSQDIDFSQTYFLDEQSMLVRVGSGITQIQDLNGKLIAAIEGSTSIDNIEAEASRLGIDIEIFPLQEYGPAIDLLKEGVVHALTTDRVALIQFASQNPDLEVLDTGFNPQPYGMGLPQNDSMFRDMVNFTLQKLKRNGVYDEIYAKWFPNEEPYDIELFPGTLTYTIDGPFLPLNLPPSAIRRLTADLHLRAGIQESSPPFSYLDDNNQRVGFDIDIIQEFADRWLGEDASVEFISLDSKSLFPLENDQVDLVMSVLHTGETDSLIDLSQTYYKDENGSYAIALSSNDSRFREQIDFTLQEMKSDGTYDYFYKKWFYNTESYPIQIWPGEPYDALLPTEGLTRTLESRNLVQNNVTVASTPTATQISTLPTPTYTLAPPTLTSSPIATHTPTDTPEPLTNTPIPTDIPTLTHTPEPPTSTPTATHKSVAAINTSVSTHTSTATYTSEPPTQTSIVTETPVSIHTSQPVTITSVAMISTSVQALNEDLPAPDGMPKTGGSYTDIFRNNLLLVLLIVLSIVLYEGLRWMKKHTLRK